jgi:capsular exopolysaccharide synthesis family protein
MRNENTVDQFAKGESKREPMTVAEVFSIVKIYRYYYFAFSIFLASLTLYSNFTYVAPYVANAVISVQAAKGKSVGVPGVEAALGTSTEEEQINKFLSYLHSADFNLYFAKELKFRPASNVVIDLTSPLNKSGSFRTLFHRNSAANKIQDLTMTPLEQVAELLPALVTFKRDEQTTIAITASAMDPQSAVYLVNTAAEVFARQVMRKDSEEIGEVQSFIEARLKETTEKLQSSELELVNFKQKNHVVASQNSTNHVQDHFSRLESEAETAKIKLNELERLKTYYENKLSAYNTEILKNRERGANSPGEEASAIRTRIETLRKQQVSLRMQGVAESEAIMSEVNKNLKTDTERLRTFVENGAADAASENMDGTEIQEKLNQLKSEIKQVSVSLAELDKSREEMKSTLVGLPEQEQEVLRLERAVSLQYELYTQLKKRLQEVEIEKAGLKNPVRIEEVARGALPVLQPRLWLRLLFAELAAIFLGTLAALLGELLNTTTRNRSDLELAELVCLGNIPFVGSERKRNSASRARPDLLVCANAPDSADSMAFKFTRAQLKNILAGSGAVSNVIAITSCERAAGKSMVSANLAVSFSQLNQKTIVVDCDIRNPSLPFYFGYSRNEGLAELLEMKASLSNVLISEHLPFLDILPAGTLDRNPTEILSGERFTMLINFLKKKYQYVILDSPPALFVVDAAITTAASDAAILVARYRQTKRQGLITAHRKIQQIAPKTIYGVLNGVKDIHEYTNYNANFYFEKKLSNLRSYGDFKRKRETGTTGAHFEDFLRSEDDPNKGIKRGS